MKDCLIIIDQHRTGGKFWLDARNDTFGGVTGNKSIITWGNSTIKPAGSTADLGFQVQSLENGTIIFSYIILESSVQPTRQLPEASDRNAASRRYVGPLRCSNTVHPCTYADA